jgi:hypothetical protein
MRNADVENLGARGNKTGVAMLVISLSLLHKTRDTPNRVNREVSKTLSDSYQAFFLLIATTSNKNFLKVQKL